MLEWIALAVLLPLVVLPIVLLFGFAGCDVVWGLDRPDPFKGLSIFEIALDTERDRANFCLVVRLEPSRLGDISGKVMKITVARPTAGELSLRALYVSHAAATGNPYDAEADPVLVVENFVLSPSAEQNDQTVTFDQANFAYDKDKALLVAMNIGESGHVRRVDNVLVGDGRSFRGGMLVEAAQTVRSPGYVEEDNLYLVTRIEV